MENKKTIEAIVDFIVTAEKSIKNAKKLLKDLANNNEIKLDVEVDLSTKWLESYTDKESKIIEWVFTGSEMLWSDWNKYPVPANYASKSKIETNNWQFMKNDLQANSTNWKRNKNLTCS